MKAKLIKIGDSLWHPCDMDIIEHKVISIRQFEGFNHYVCKAIHNVGACGRVEIVLDEHNGKLRFIALVNEEQLEYASELQDFVEGNYYTDKREADLIFYRKQALLWSNAVDRKKQAYDEAVVNYEKVTVLLKTIRESLNETN